MSEKILIIGDGRPNHVGRHFLSAAESLGLAVHFCDTAKIFQSSPWLERKINWWLLGRRPPGLQPFNRQTGEIIEQFNPRWVLTVGLSALQAGTLQKIHRKDIRSMNFLTDHPWGFVPRPYWFLKTLEFYDHVFTPRKSNKKTLTSLCGSRVSYLPFAYAPEAHFPEWDQAKEEERQLFKSDVAFIGSADRDRIPFVRALLRRGLKISLYGAHWNRYFLTSHCGKGNADPRTMRLAIGGAKVVLGLVRRSNHDGNSMRTFEIPAIGGCMLAEDTEDHRTLFGKDGDHVVYFKRPDDLAESVSKLIHDDSRRECLARSAHALITGGKHTYRDRLEHMLKVVAQS